MIKGLFETHLHVRDLNRSTRFYVEILGLELGHYDKVRNAVFLWIGDRMRFMLGLWEKPQEEIHSGHIAFECDPGWVLNESVRFLKERKLKFRNFLRDGTECPMVFAWMPAVSIYVDDPDGHELEFIGILKGASRPDKGVISYDDWLRIEQGQEYEG